MKTNHFKHTIIFIICQLLLLSCAEVEGDKHPKYPYLHELGDILPSDLQYIKFKGEYNSSIGDSPLFEKFISNGKHYYTGWFYNKQNECYTSIYVNNDASVYKQYTNTDLSRITGHKNTRFTSEIIEDYIIAYKDCESDNDNDPLFFLIDFETNKLVKTFYVIPFDTLGFSLSTYDYNMNKYNIPSSPRNDIIKQLPPLKKGEADKEEYKSKRVLYQTTSETYARAYLASLCSSPSVSLFYHKFKCYIVLEDRGLMIEINSMVQHEICPYLPVFDKLTSEKSPELGNDLKLECWDKSLHYRTPGAGRLSFGYDNHYLYYYYFISANDTLRFKFPYELEIYDYVKHKKRYTIVFKTKERETFNYYRYIFVQYAANSY